ncbi:MAG TPA: hypothetical protein VMZ28_23090 [Kofleriaceae bacterium]|nr:hypothetical protein [Kofleriaceae bacterium]
MRLALAIVLTTSVFSTAAHAHGSGKQKQPRKQKAGVKFVVDRVNKHGQVVERDVVTGPIGRTRGRAKGKARTRARQLTMEQQVKGMIAGVAVDETDAAMPTELTLKGRLEEVESVSSTHNGGTTTRTKLRRKGAGHDHTAVETRVYARGKLRRIRPAEVLEEPQMLGKGGAVNAIGSIEIASGPADEDGERDWSEMSGLGLAYHPSSPFFVVLNDGPYRTEIPRDLLNEAMTKGLVTRGTTQVANDGEHVTVEVDVAGEQRSYRMPTAHLQGVLRSSYRSVPRGDEGRWLNLDAELDGL